MIPELLLFAFALVVNAALLFLYVYFIITLSDLENDYLNAQQCCNKLNFWVIPKFGAHLILFIGLVINGHWILFLLNFPMIAWLFHEQYRLPTGHLGVYDPIEIHNRGMIKKHLRDAMILMGYYLVMFFVYLYCMINALLRGDPIRRHEEGEIITNL